MPFTMVILALIFLCHQFLGGKCSAIALTNKLSQLVCASYENKQFGKIRPDQSTDSSFCPLVAKSNQAWEYKNCGTASGNSKLQTKGPNVNNYGYVDNASYAGNPRIQTGHPAEPHSHPYIAYIPGKNTQGNRKSLDIQGIIYNQYTIISTDKIMKLRAGYGGEPNWIYNIPVRFGKHNVSAHETFEQTRFICGLTMHPNKDEDELNAFSLIHLSDPIIFNEFASAIPLYYVAEDGKESTISNNCMVAGWGDIQYSNATQVLYEANVTVTDQCKIKGKEKKGILCTDAEDDQSNIYCHGDSGEPLLCSNKGQLFARAIVMDDENRECDKRYATNFLHFNKPHIIKWIETEYKNHRGICREIEL